jgi:hypothetical protein
MRDLKSTQLDILLFLYLLHTLSIHYPYTIHTLSMEYQRSIYTLSLFKMILDIY